jgi:hypothetical protein
VTVAPYVISIDRGVFINFNHKYICNPNVRDILIKDKISRHTNIITKNLKSEKTYHVYDVCNSNLKYFENFLNIGQLFSGNLILNTDSILYSRMCTNVCLLNHENHPKLKTTYPYNSYKDNEIILKEGTFLSTEYSKAFFTHIGLINPTSEMIEMYFGNRLLCKNNDLTPLDIFSVKFDHTSFVDSLNVCDDTMKYIYTAFAYESKGQLVAVAYPMNGVVHYLKKYIL